MNTRLILIGVAIAAFLVSGCSEQEKTSLTVGTASAPQDEVLLVSDTVRSSFAIMQEHTSSTRSAMSVRRPALPVRPMSTRSGSGTVRGFSHIPTSTAIRPSRSPASVTTLDTAASQPTLPPSEPSIPPDAPMLRITTQRASIAFNAPDEIQLDDVQRVQLRLSLQKKVEELKRDIVESGTTEGASVQIGNVVSATLSGDGFQITELTPSEQGIIESDDTEWRWQVTPTEPGEHFLNVSLSTKLKIDGKDITRSIKTYEHQIRVNVTVTQIVSGFVSKNWQWLWAVVVAPIAAFGWKKVRMGKGDATV
ncbi:hypothetical protein BH10BAC6_BH10BAC6_17890 [soil metagenome]